MNAKQIVLEALHRLPDDISFHDISEEVAFLEAIREGDEQIKQGNVIPNEDMKRRLVPWLAK